MIWRHFNSEVALSQDATKTPAHLDLLSEAEVSRILGRSSSALRKDRLAGRGVPFVRLFGQIRYKRGDIERYISALPSFTSTSEADLARSRPS